GHQRGGQLDDRFVHALRATVPGDKILQGEEVRMLLPCPFQLRRDLSPRDEPLADRLDVGRGPIGGHVVTGGNWGIRASFARWQRSVVGWGGHACRMRRPWIGRWW